MITELSHATLLVEDQDEALAFYTEVLGFEVRDDVPTEEGRWLTVSPAESESPQLVLMAAESDDQRAAVGEQVPGYTTFVLYTDDCRGEYDRLSAAGVAFHGEPEEHPWGMEVQFEDPNGTVFDLMEPYEMDEEAMAAMTEEADQSPS